MKSRPAKRWSRLRWVTKRIQSPRAQRRLVVPPRVLSVRVRTLRGRNVSKRRST